MNVMLAAGGWNQHGRIRGASPKSVEPIGVRSKNRGVAIKAQFRAPFEGMRTTRVNHVLLELVHVSIRTEYGSIGRIKTLKKTVAKGDRGLGRVAGEEKRSAPNVADGRLIAEAWSRRAGIFYGRASLVIEELHAKVRIQRGLIGVRRRPGDLVAAGTQNSFRANGGTRRVSKSLL